ncbi:DUF58 domain-containing protein [Actinomyces viscosus]|uniref:DUF58 domain-containing protein n=1 Tax=Actinomyces viscosus TaxID=1656 RepID=UPI0018D55C44|nr:DUF58 domain-containing protein [Actinomyces viscosus]
MPPRTTSPSSARQARPGSAGRAGSSSPSTAPSPRSSGASPSAASPASAASAVSSASASAALTARPARSRLIDAVAAVLRPLRWLLHTITPIGWGSLVLLAACGLTGAVMGWQEAWSAAIVVGIVVVTAWLWLIPRGGYSVNHNLLEPRVTVGDHALIRLTVTNPRPRPLLPSRMEMPVGPGRAVFVVPTLTPRAVHERGFVLPTQRRGIVTVGPVLAVQRDPVGLLQRERSLTTPQHIHIHPRTLRLGTVLHGVLRDIEGAVTQDLSSSDVAFHALRDYVPGDDRRNVHWRTTARTGRLMVRQFEETRRSSLLVLLSTRQDDYAGEEDFETAVSIACSLTMDAIQDGREVRFITQIGALPTSSSLRMLDTSCLLSTGEDDVSCDLLVRHACTAHPEASIVVLVTGQQVDRATLARARGFAPLSMVAVTLRAGQQGLSRHHAGTMPVVDMDRLEQLPTALRRAL